jgi:hypothetical protein
MADIIIIIMLSNILHFNRTLFSASRFSMATKVPKEHTDMIHLNGFKIGAMDNET